MPRSGTTLLARVVSTELHIPFAPETHFFTYAYRKGEVSLDRLPKEVLEDPRVAAAYKKIQGHPRSMETFRLLLHEIIGDATTIGEKTPAHLVFFSEILKADPQVISIATSRDFFEVIESLRKVYWNTAPFSANLRRCIRYHRIAHMTQRHFRERLLVVDYKKLCEDEQSVMEALAKWLPRGEHRYAQQIFNPAVEPWKSEALSDPKVIKRKVPLQRIHLWLTAKLAFMVCNIIWPLKTVHSR